MTVGLLQPFLCAVGLLAFRPAVVNGFMERDMMRPTYFSTQFGCVGFIYDNNYERLCDNDNFGKLIYPEPDGAIRITIFSGFPPERDNPKAKAGPKFQQDYELRDYDEVWVTADNCLAHTVINMIWDDVIQDCPPHAYVGENIPNPYKMSNDGVDKIPVSFGPSGWKMGDGNAPPEADPSSSVFSASGDGGNMFRRNPNRRSSMD